jgi:hypothetical protein
MHSIRTDSQFFRDALERVGKAEDLRSVHSPASMEPEQRKAGQIDRREFQSDQREPQPARVIGRLVALNGTQGVISCPLKTGEED